MRRKEAMGHTHRDSGISLQRALALCAMREYMEYMELYHI